MIEIDLKNKSLSFSNLITLDGVSYSFAFRYDISNKAWYLSIDNVLHGRKLVLGIDILRHFHHLAVPPLPLQLVSTGNGIDKPDYEQLNDTVRLVYG